MMRISSGQDLQLLDSSTSNAAASSLSSTYLEVDSSNTSALSPVGEALASADHGTLPADMQHIGEVSSDRNVISLVHLRVDDWLLGNCWGCLNTSSCSQLTSSIDDLVLYCLCRL